MWAFNDCDKMTSIFIPNNVTNIGTEAFGYCDNLTIYGCEGSFAETYAVENDIPFLVRENESFAETNDSIESDENTESIENKTQENKISIYS